MQGKKNWNNAFLWYVGYGSNLCHDRFICYIQGRKFQLGGSDSKGCLDRTLPSENKPFIIPHCLFFGKSASGWENGGVAFISPEPEPDENKHTYGRMWKITLEQFSEIKKQEGGWYNTTLDLGRDGDGISICTITNSVEPELNKPSDKYLRTIVIGLKETYRLDNKKILKYLIEKPGIKGNFTKEKLLEIID